VSQVRDCLMRMEDRDASCHISCTKRLGQILRSNVTQTTSLCMEASEHPDLGLWLKQTSFMYITYSVLCGLHEVEKMD
jgi:hypothetical protein